MGGDRKSKSNRFSRGDLTDTDNLVLDNNLYWNGRTRIPDGDLISPRLDDGNRIIANPLLASDQKNAVLPYWNGITFLSGNETIRQEFERLVMEYGEISVISFAKNNANPAFAPPDDILGQKRGQYPDVGAYEYPVDFLINIFAFLRK
jgi:hypothetical protein